MDRFVLGFDRNAVGTSHRRLMRHVLRQMSVARHCLDIAVSGQLADHRNGLAERPGTGREAVPEIRSRTRWDNGLLSAKAVVILDGTDHLNPQLSDATVKRLRTWETS